MSSYNILECPVRKCNVKFKSQHYTDKIPHLETHSQYELADALSSVFVQISWSQTMATETIDAMETLLPIKGTGENNDEIKERGFSNDN